MAQRTSVPRICVSRSCLATYSSINCSKAGWLALTTLGQEAILDYDVPACANQSPKACNGLLIVPQHGPDAQQEGYIILRFLTEQIPNVSLLEATAMGDAPLRREHPRGLQKRQKTYAGLHRLRNRFVKVQHHRENSNLALLRPAQS
jgi:hypothetical protein